MDDLRSAVAYEVSVQAERGFLKMLKGLYNVEVPTNSNAIDALVEAGLYVLGDADYVTSELKDFYDTSGGFGTFLMVSGKAWADRERRHRNMRLFMEQVAPQLRPLEPS